MIIIITKWFPDGSDGKASAYNAGDPGLIRGSGRSSGEGNGTPLQYSGMEKSHGRRGMVGYNLWGRKELDTWVTSLSFFIPTISAPSHFPSTPKSSFIAPAECAFECIDDDAGKQLSMLDRGHRSSSTHCMLCAHQSGLALYTYWSLPFQADFPNTSIWSVYLVPVIYGCIYLKWYLDR